MDAIGLGQLLGIHQHCAAVGGVEVDGRIGQTVVVGEVQRDQLIGNHCRRFGLLDGFDRLFLGRVHGHLVGGFLGFLVVSVLGQFVNGLLGRLVGGILGFLVDSLIRGGLVIGLPGMSFFYINIVVFGGVFIVVIFNGRDTIFQGDDDDLVIGHDAQLRGIEIAQNAKLIIVLRCLDGEVHGVLGKGVALQLAHGLDAGSLHPEHREDVAQQDSAAVDDILGLLHGLLGLVLIHDLQGHGVLDCRRGVLARQLGLDLVDGRLDPRTDLGRDVAVVVGLGLNGVLPVRAVGGQLGHGRGQGDLGVQGHEAVHAGQVMALGTLLEAGVRVRMLGQAADQRAGGVVAALVVNVLLDAAGRYPLKRIGLQLQRVHSQEQHQRREQGDPAPHSPLVYPSGNEILSRIVELLHQVSLPLFYV